MTRWPWLPLHLQVVWQASSVRLDASGEPRPYDADARLADAPGRFSAVSFAVWCFGQAGVLLEEDLLKLVGSGVRIVGSDIEAADLIFRNGRHDLYLTDRSSHGIGHVGICTGEGTVLHASPFAGCVQEDSMDDFLDLENGHFRGVRRIIARP